MRLALEPLESRLLLAGFTAYNALWGGGATHANTTLYSEISGHDSAGLLRDIETGANTGVLLTTSSVGINFGGAASNPAQGTDAHDIFSGFVDFAAGSSQRSVETEANDSYQYAFENLDPGATYEFAGSAMRGNPAYTNRWTLVQLLGAESFTPAHSGGVGTITEGLAANQVVIWFGYNSGAGLGYVAQWKDIDPGADGEFTVVSTQWRGAIPTSVDSGGVADGNKGYSPSGIRLIENVPSAPPTVVGAAATGVQAFEATVGGSITGTGGQVPEVTIYFGDNNGGTNPAAWDEAISLGGHTGDFSTVVAELESNTQYYFRAFAENTIGVDWADATQSFTTLSATAPAAINLSAADVGAFAATLRGQITNTGNDTPAVTVYYGNEDGGSDPNAWDESVFLDGQSGTFEAAATGLERLTTYYFAAFVQNRIGGRWAAPSLSFTTTDTPPLVITEFMADNGTSLRTRTRDSRSDPFAGDRLSPDWFEIHNPTPATVDLGGLHLTDDLSKPTRWEIPIGTTIGPGGFLVFFASGDDITDPELDENGYLHTNFKLSAGGGEDLAITDAAGVVLFAFENFPSQTEDVSYGIDAAQNERTFAIPTPGEDNANDTPKAAAFGTPSGTFTGSMLLALSKGRASDTIRYTLNGAAPTASSTVYNGPLTLTDTAQVRTIVIGTGGKRSTVVSQTYVKLSDTALGVSSNLPIVIVETFGRGINGKSSGFGTTFIGVIEPGEDGRSRLTDSFTVDTRAGMHIRGSSSAGFSKKQYRVEFWDEDGQDRKLRLLGMPEEADWIFYGPGPFDRNLISNPLIYDLSNQIGRYAVRTRWVEVYINDNGGRLNASDYRGIYAIMEVIERDDERVDVERLSSGTGGLPVSGGFVWKNDRGSAYVDPEGPNTAQRGYINGWINSLRSAAASSNFKDPNVGYARWADVGSFIDHNLLNIVPMNVDALRLSSFYFKTADGKLEAGPIWDFDRSFDSTDGRDNNPRRWFGTGDSTRPFNDSDRVMSWWPDMYQDPDFVQAMIDRWFELREGAFSLESINATIDRHASILAEAAPRDYARWSRSRYGDFAGEIRHLKDWLTSRINWIDAQWLKAPTSNVAGPVVSPGTRVTLSTPTGTVYYTLDGSDPRGDNGSRRGTQATSPITIDRYTKITARVYLSGHGPNQGYIASGDDWSAPLVLEYFVNPLAGAGDLAISEINYNPHDPTEAELALQTGSDLPWGNDDFEFVEVVNVSGHTLNISGVQFTDGISFTFDSHVLANGGRLVIVEDLGAFVARYGENVSLAGVYSSNLSNGGELLVVTGPAGEEIYHDEYGDSGAWPERADGGGSSLELKSLTADPALASSWRNSHEFGGSPGTAGSGKIVDVVVNEVLTHTDPPLTDSIELLNTSGAAIDVSGWFLSDSKNNYRKFRIPDGTIIAAGGYLVFDEGDFNPSGGFDPANHPNDFALSGAHGDDVWLLAADDDGRLTRFADHAEFDAAASGVSFGRVQADDGRWHLAPMSSRTFDAANAEVRFGPLVISEIMYDPPMPSTAALAIDPALLSEDLEFVEIFNPTAQRVDLENWRLDKGVDIKFDAGESIAAGGTLVVVSFNPDRPDNAERLAAFRSHYGIDQSVVFSGGYSGKLENAGERLQLQRPDEPPLEEPGFFPGLVEDEVKYDVAAPWPSGLVAAGHSLHRSDPQAWGNHAASWNAAAPTPGSVPFEITGPPADLTGNGFVDFADLTVLLANWNENVGASAGNLVRPDSTPVNFEDLTVLLAAWTGPGPAAAPLPAAEVARVANPASGAESDRFDRLGREEALQRRASSGAAAGLRGRAALRRLQAVAVDAAMELADDEHLPPRRRRLRRTI
ncbi:MAG: lamin tail domain-containing protein [Planctomycetes bacterium]|nr:lamin tail domain-containing protein [Planctomycetota bacterium]